MAPDCVEDAESACSVSLQTQFEYPSYPFNTSEKLARCVVSLRAKDADLDRVPIDLCAVVDRYAAESSSLVGFFGLLQLWLCQRYPVLPYAGREVCGEASWIL